jgi:hypothetical protein
MRTGLAKLLLDANSEKVIDCIQQSQEVIKIKSQSLQQDLQQCTTIISSADSGIQLTFYPTWAPWPILNIRNSNQRFFISHQSQDTISSTVSAAIAMQHYLIDSRATQHMTPCLADLEIMVQGKKLGVEVADGHIIKCPAVGKI